MAKQSSQVSHKSRIVFDVLNTFKAYYLIECAEGVLVEFS
jgi:hypothetical protein